MAHGADWALRLTTDQAADLQLEPKSIGLTLREFPLGMISYSYVDEIRTLIDGLQISALILIFCHFAPRMSVSSTS